MPASVQVAFESWSCPVGLTLAVVLTGVLYLRGWLRLHSASVNAIPSWRAGSFFLGLFLIWLAVGSPLAAFDEELLTVHMIQHLLLMTVAPPLILVGAPVMPLLHSFPRKFVQSILGPLLRWPLMKGIGRVLSQPAFCWLSAAVALLGWHIPAVFTLGLESEWWHAVEHACFFSGGPLCSRGRVFRDGRVGRCSSTFFSLPCRVTFSPHFLRSATVLFTPFISPHPRILESPLLKTNNAQAH